MSNDTDMYDKYCGHSNDIHPIQSQYKGNHKRGGAAEGRATSFVVAANGRHLCILALNRVNVVAVTTILVLHVGVIGHHVPCHYDFMFPRRSYHARLRARGCRGSGEAEGTSVVCGDSSVPRTRSPQNGFCGDSPHRVTANYGDTVMAPLIITKVR